MWRLEGTSTSGASELPSHAGTSQTASKHLSPSLTLASAHRETLDDVLHRIVQLMQDDDCVSSWDHAGSSVSEHPVTDPSASCSLKPCVPSLLTPESNHIGLSLNPSPCSLCL